MFDDLRKDADIGFPEEGDDNIESSPAFQQPEKHFLGMTPLQRFIIALMLLMMTCIISTFCLLVTEKIVPPIIQ